MLTEADNGLKLSPGIFEGGVKRLPTLSAAPLAWDVLIGIGCVDFVCWNEGTEGRLRLLASSEAAGLRAVKLVLCPLGSIPVAMPTCFNSFMDAWMFGSWPRVGGLNTSDSDPGGVGNVCDGGRYEVVDASAPGHN